MIWWSGVKEDMRSFGPSHSRLCPKRMHRLRRNIEGKSWGD